MAIDEINGFKFLNGEMITIEDNRVDEYISYICENKIRSVYLCNLYFRDRDIDFLKKIDFIEKLSITSSGIKEYQVLQDLKNLQNLSIQEVEGPINLEYNQALIELGIKMTKNVIGVNKLKNLKTLRLYNYNPKSKSLSELSELKNLENLKISNSSIESFKGCESLNNLENIELSY